MKATATLATFFLAFSCALADGVTNAPPVITKNPVSQSVADGSFVLFRVTATGTPPLTYQWFFNDQSITNATTGSLVIADVQLQDAGSYSAVVSNSFGSVTSLVAALVVDGANAFGVAGIPFQYQIAANNNPSGFFASGLPPGLFLNPSSGVISGIPTASGFYPVHVEARSIFNSVSDTVGIYIGQGKITSPGTADGIVGVAFFYQVTADNTGVNNGTRYTASGLPSGLHFDSTFGVISGTPTRSGSFPVKVQAINFYGSASATIVIEVHEGEITSAGSADAIVDLPFTYQITADNNPVRYTTSTLPSGLHFNNTLGLISGTPTRSGSFPIAVTAQNFYGSASGTIVININNPGITGTTQSTLGISRTGSAVLLSWPTAPVGFVLEETTSEQNAWSNSPVSIGVQGDKNVASIPIQAAAKFYRLRKL